MTETSPDRAAMIDPLDTIPAFPADITADDPAWDRAKLAHNAWQSVMTPPGEKPGSWYRLTMRERFGWRNVAGVLGANRPTGDPTAAGGDEWMTSSTGAHDPMPTWRHVPECIVRADGWCLVATGRYGWPYRIVAPDGAVHGFVLDDGDRWVDGDAPWDAPDWETPEQAADAAIRRIAESDPPEWTAELEDHYQRLGAAFGVAVRRGETSA